MLYWYRAIQMSPSLKTHRNSPYIGNLRDYSTALRIDTNRIGLVGHSLGAFSAIIASIMDQKMGNNWINATIGIGGPALNITNSVFYRLIADEYVYPYLWFNLSTALEIAVLEGKKKTLLHTILKKQQKRRKI